MISNEETIKTKAKVLNDIFNFVVETFFIEFI